MCVWVCANRDVIIVTDTTCIPSIVGESAHVRSLALFPYFYYAVSWATVESHARSAIAVRDD